MFRIAFGWLFATLATLTSVAQNKYVLVKGDCDNTMSIPAIIKLETDEVSSPRYEVGSFIDGVCRGAYRDQIDPVGGHHIFFLAVWGKSSFNGKEISFRIYDHETDEEFLIHETIPFEYNNNIDLHNPFRLSFGAPVVDASAPTIRTEPQDIVVNRNQTQSLVVTAVVDDEGTLSYRWYRNTTSSTVGGTPIEGATASSYTVPTGTPGDYYYYVVVRNTNNRVNGTPTAESISRVAKVTVLELVHANAPAINEHPAGATYDLNAQPISLTVRASSLDGGVLSYQWYDNTSNSNEGGERITGATTAGFSPPTNSVGTRYYYVVVTNSREVSGNREASIRSNVATVVVNPIIDALPPIIHTQPQNRAVLINTPSVFLAVAATSPDNGNLSFQWFRNMENSTVGGEAIEGEITAGIVVPTAEIGMFYYYIEVTNTNNNVNGNRKTTLASRVAEVIVNNAINAETPQFTRQPLSFSVDEGATAPVLSVEAEVTDEGVLTYQWFSNTTQSNDGGELIPGAQSSTYVVPTALTGTYYYYVVATNTIANNQDGGQKTASAASEVARVSVNTHIQTPVISTQPFHYSVFAGAEIDLSVTAAVADGGELSYQWFRSDTESNTEGTAIPEATESVYSPSTAEPGTYYYYVIVTNNNPDAAGEHKTSSVTSRVAVVVVSNMMMRYLVTVEQTTNGKVECNTPIALYNEEIFLKPIPDDGYETDTLYVKTVAGSDVELTAADNEYSFRMPATDVVVTARFRIKQSLSDEEALNAAMLLLSALNFVVTQGECTTVEELELWFTEIVQPLLNQTGVATHLIIGGFVPATEGTEENPLGKNGSFSFVISVKRGGATGYVPVTNGVITATPFTPTGVDEIDAMKMQVSSTADGLLVEGLRMGETVYLYSMSGQLISSCKAMDNRQFFPLRARGMYILTTGKRSVKAIF